MKQSGDETTITHQISHIIENQYHSNHQVKQDEEESAKDYYCTSKQIKYKENETQS